MSDFEQRYSAHSTKELLAIVNNPGKYLPAAIRAAKGVLASRNLTDTEIETIKAELKSERDAEIKKENDKKVAAERLRNSVSTFASETNPISMSRSPVSRTITIICIVFGLIALYHVANEWSLIEFMFTDVNAKWGDGEMVLYFVPLTWLPVAVVLFAFRKKAGWIMLAVYLSASITSAISVLVTFLPGRVPGSNLHSCPNHLHTPLSRVH